MKVQNFLLTIVLSILTISCANSKKVVYADNSRNLSQNQLCLLNYSKETYQTGDNKILLPTELNVLLGDSTAMQNIVAQPIWDNAYFVEDGGHDILIVPMKANHNNVELFSDLLIMKADTIYPELVSTYLECKTDKKTEYVHIESNINGKVYRAIQCNKHGKEIIRIGLNYGIGKNKWSSRGSSRKSGNILYRNDWRNANNKGYHIDYQGNKVLNKKDY